MVNQSPIKIPIYSDINTNYRVTRQGIIVTDVDAINNEIHNILTTVPGERCFEPEFGARINDLVFEPTNDRTAWAIETEIKFALERWMPHIRINDRGTFVRARAGERTFDVTISYTIKSINQQSTTQVRIGV